MKASKSRAKSPIAIAGRGLVFAFVLIMPKGMFESEKWQSAAIGSQLLRDMIKRGCRSTEKHCDVVEGDVLSICDLEGR